MDTDEKPINEAIEEFLAEIDKLEGMTDGQKAQLKVVCHTILGYSLHMYKETGQAIQGLEELRKNATATIVHEMTADGVAETVRGMVEESMRSIIRQWTKDTDTIAFEVASRMVRYVDTRASGLYGKIDRAQAVQKAAEVALKTRLVVVGVLAGIAGGVAGEILRHVSWDAWLKAVMTWIG